MTSDDVHVFLLPLPHRVRAFSTPNNDGTYTIVLNARLSAHVQREAYRHELNHIVANDHGDTETTADEREQRARRRL